MAIDGIKYSCDIIPARLERGSWDYRAANRWASLLTRMSNEPREFNWTDIGTSRSYYNVCHLALGANEADTIKETLIIFDFPSSSLTSFKN